jgi:transposase InsO family protein
MQGSRPGECLDAHGSHSGRARASRVRPRDRCGPRPPQRPVELGQYLSTRYTEHLAAVGIETSVGSRGDAYDNALAESVIGLFKTEVIRHAGPWRGLDDVEYATWNG